MWHCVDRWKQKKSREESSGEGSGVEILVNEPYTDGPGPTGSGQYTQKVYHIDSHLPGLYYCTCLNYWYHLSINCITAPISITCITLPVSIAGIPAPVSITCITVPVPITCIAAPVSLHLYLLPVSLHLFQLHYSSFFKL